MNKITLEKKLRDKPSYLYWGDVRISKYFKVSIKAAKEIKEKLKKEGVGHRKENSKENNILFKIKDSKLKNSNECKILLLDIETSPLLTYLWDIWNQNVNLDAIQSEWFIITWAAKWYGDNEIITGKLTSTEAVEKNDSNIIQEIWKLVNKADIVITYNGDKFDMKKLNTRFLLHGLPKPLPYHSIDLFKEVKKEFSFTSNKLDYVNKQLKIGRKIKHEGLQLWLDCMKGKQSALDKMEEYNVGDVVILEDLYNKLKKWIKGHPALYKEENKCPVCGSTNLTFKGSFGKILKYPVYRCECGQIVKGNKSTGEDKSNNNTL